MLAACAAPHYQADLLRAQLNAPYLLASGDRLRVIVFGQDNLSNSFSVDGAGNISMPLIGLVKASGLTTADLERVDRSAAAQRLLREPRVSVEVEAYRPFFVLGEVTTAGQYPFINGMTVQNAVAVAGGYHAARIPGRRRHHARRQRAPDHLRRAARLFRCGPAIRSQVRERFF